MSLPRTSTTPQLGSTRGWMRWPISDYRRESSTSYSAITRVSIHKLTNILNCKLVSAFFVKYSALPTSNYWRDKRLLGIHPDQRPYGRVHNSSHRLQPHRRPRSEQQRREPAPRPHVRAEGKFLPERGHWRQLVLGDRELRSLERRDACGLGRRMVRGRSKNRRTLCFYLMRNHEFQDTKGLIRVMVPATIPRRTTTMKGPKNARRS